MTERWGYASDDEAERWTGAYATREEAIAAGREEFGVESFWVASGTRPDAGDYFPDAHDMIETAEQVAYDAVGEASEDWSPTPSKEAREELEAFITAWANKHCPCDFWVADGVREEIPALDACDPTGAENAKIIAVATALAGDGEKP